MPLLGAVALMMLSAGCAQEEDRSTNQIQKEYIEAWLSQYYPDVDSTGLGIYILEDQPGTGEEIADSDYYAFLNYTVCDMDGTISNTTYEDVAQQIGDYSKSTYYGQQIIVRNRSLSTTGVLEALKGMRIGGYRMVLVPGWLNVVKDYSSAEKYFKKGDGSNAIYKITLEGKTADIIKWEEDTLRSYVNTHMNGIDTTFYGYYYLQLREPDDTSTFPTDTSFYINYVGKLLNGHVFDTNIEDTAKFYGIYSSSTTYAPKYITMSDTYTSITMADDASSTGSTVVTGFAYCLSKLKSHEKGVCAFYSELGYSYSGSGTSVPSFAPLVFEIEQVDEPDD